MGAVRLMQGRPFVAGPHINVYNPHTLQLLAEAGATRWVMPLEMSRTMLDELLAAAPRQMETEVFAYGRMPLAFSARCFTARRHNLPKDNCQFRCIENPYGMTLKTREGQPFLALNGTQTQSASVYSLLPELESLSGLADVLRISPQPAGTGAVIDLFCSALDGAVTPQQAAQALAPLLPEAACDGYWHGRAGIEPAASAAHGRRL